MMIENVLRQKIQTIYHKVPSSRPVYYSIATLSFFVNCCNMSDHIFFLGTVVVTNVTFEWFLFLMKWFNMNLLQVFLSWVAVFTSFTFEWFISFASLLSKGLKWVINPRTFPIANVQFFMNLISNCDQLVDG